MELGAIHDKLEDIPEPYRELYTEKGGKWELTGIKGIKTQADVDRLDLSLKGERNQHKETKGKLAAWADFGEPSEVRKQLDRIAELEAAASGKLDDAKIDEIAAKRADGIVKSRTAPLERDNVGLKRALEEALGKVKSYEDADRKRKIHDVVRAALKKAKALPDAEEDALLLGEHALEVTEDGRVVTKEGVANVTPGADVDGWLAELQPRRSHWWPPSQGGGAGGSGRGGGGQGKNPWTHEFWNMGEQGRIYTTDPARAKMLAQAAGTSIGGARPQPRPAKAG